MHLFRGVLIDHHDPVVWADADIGIRVFGRVREAEYWPPLIWSAKRVIVPRFRAINRLASISSRRGPSRFEMISTNFSSHSAPPIVFESYAIKIARRMVTVEFLYHRYSGIWGSFCGGLAVGVDHRHTAMRLDCCR